MARSTMSDVPPALKPAMMVTGWVGYSTAGAGHGIMKAAARAARRKRFIWHSFVEDSSV